MNISSLLASAFLGVVWLDGAIALREGERRRPILTCSVCFALTVCLLAQLRHPQLLEMFQRNTMEIMKGEWLRILTAVFFQDGWTAGGVTNIALLLGIGSLCEQVWSRSDWLMIGIAGALIGELLGLRWEPVGAGNSVVTCSLAGSLLVARPLRKRSSPSKLMTTIAMALCLLLVAQTDIHGAAALTGILVGLTRPILGH